MNRNAIASVLVAALILLAGCSGGMGGSPSTAMDGAPAGEESTAGTADGSTGTVNLYISDEQNAIGDFEHLNVTISKVGLKPAGDVDDSDDSDDVDETNETADADEGSETADDSADADDTDGADDEDDDAGDDEWVEYEVDNRTVDLTRLQGANATRLSTLDVPNGTYEKVFVYVSEVDGTLKDGSDQRVKLPSGKLQLNSEFTVGNGESVDFVFDITAIKAGQSGKYILKPVISESGTDVEIERVDDEDDDDRGDDEDEREESTLNATFLDDIAPGENATLRVTKNGSAVENATVEVEGGPSGTTDANGEYVVSVPDDAEELEVTVTYEDVETELEFEFDEDEDDADDETDDQAGQGQSDQSAANA
ncbi:DUF4382 domain-containing protein [Halobellus salinisoli]|uniref:DUF4382 domain-containing protein n=1 Tax=Halobellus salinisoli TaxID=3108500 RepID=UPI00300A12A3